MCYQTRLIKKREELMNRFNAEIDALSDYEPIEFCSAFEYPKTPIITNLKPEKIELYQWGLIPRWSNNDAIKQYTLNARIETLNEKASFKDIIQNRCLILADGFYEWQWKDSKGTSKEKFLITKPNDELFAFAGIYTQWINFDSTIINSYTIVTTQANEIMSKIHNTKHRMPVILKNEDEQKWLQGKDYKNFALPFNRKLITTSLNPNNQLGLF